ncbi:hypothetical protein, partial [Flexistipes sinusarabici]|uniref:hypothetical protein n=1 Tax=Flexistipes sinusarabici TaxID=2352 RepID=UPI002352DB28
YQSKRLVLAAGILSTGAEKSQTLFDKRSLGFACPVKSGLPGCFATFNMARGDNYMDTVISTGVERSICQIFMIVCLVT